MISEFEGPLSAAGTDKYLSRLRKCRLVLALLILNLAVMEKSAVWRWSYVLIYIKTTQEFINPSQSWMIFSHRCLRRLLGLFWCHSGVTRRVGPPVVGFGLVALMHLSVIFVFTLDKPKCICTVCLCWLAGMWNLIFLCLWHQMYLVYLGLSLLYTHLSGRHYSPLSIAIFISSDKIDQRGSRGGPEAVHGGTLTHTRP